jgi:hypothetical protein
LPAPPATAPTASEISVIVVIACSSARMSLVTCNLLSTRSGGKPWLRTHW